MTFTTSASDGVTIVADRIGDPAAPAVVFLHGGGQTRRSWGKAAAAVAGRGWQAVTVDFRGHGESDWSADGERLAAGVGKDGLFGVFERQLREAALSGLEVVTGGAQQVHPPGRFGGKDEAHAF